MVFTVLPVFLVILLGYAVGRRRHDGRDAEALINHYVLYVALPALLFQAIATAGAAELAQWGFVVSTLAGIAAVYALALVVVRWCGVRLPQASIVGMGACYGTTGYMGIPIAVAAFGESAALPAAVGTVLHNVPAMLAVMLSWDLATAPRQGPRVSRVRALGKALWSVARHPLVVAVAAGVAVALWGQSLPPPVTACTRFLGAAAGPTALFALGLGLAKLRWSRQQMAALGGGVLLVVGLKLLVQPAITYGVARYGFGMSSSGNLWLAVALVLAAQPVGAGVHVFARQYGFGEDATALAIVLSLLLSLISLPVLLQLLA